jgi:hypothetical protein
MATSRRPVYSLLVVSSAIAFCVILYQFQFEERAHYYRLWSPAGKLWIDRNHKRVSFYCSNETSQFSYQTAKGGYNDGNTPAYEFEHKDVHVALGGFEFLVGTYHGTIPSKGSALALSHPLCLILASILPFWWLLSVARKAVSKRICACPLSTLGEPDIGTRTSDT